MKILLAPAISSFLVGCILIVLVYFHIISTSAAISDFVAVCLASFATVIAMYRGRI